MINAIILILMFLVGGILFSWLRSIIFKNVKSIIKTNCSIGKVYHKDGKERFQWSKFKKMFYLGDGVEWIKSIKEIVDARKLIIYCLIIGTVFAYGWYKGRLNTPVRVNMSYDKEWIMNINGEEIYKPKFSHDVFIRDTKTKQILKQIKAKDMGLLRNKLKPIGFQLEPIFVAGVGLGKKGAEGELGAGLSWLRYWRWRISSFITNKGLYPLATDYKITDNSGIGIGVGKGYIRDNRIILYYRWRF